MDALRVTPSRFLTIGLLLAASTLMVRSATRSEKPPVVVEFHGCVLMAVPTIEPPIQAPSPPSELEQLYRRDVSRVNATHRAYSPCRDNPIRKGCP